MLFFLRVSDCRTLNTIALLINLADWPITWARDNGTDSVLRFTGCAGVLVGFPFDTVKVHLQTQNHRNPLYRGTYDCFRKIVVREGVHGLYRGMSSPMAGVAVVNAIVFGVYGNIQRRTANPDSLYSHFLAGSAAGLAQSIVCSPMELIKTRLQLQDNLPRAAERFSGPMDCTRAIWRREGYRGIFRGLGITAARDMPGKLCSSECGVFPWVYNSVSLSIFSQDSQATLSLTSTWSGALRIHRRSLS